MCHSWLSEPPTIVTCVAVADCGLQVALRLGTCLVRRRPSTASPTSGLCSTARVCATVVSNKIKLEILAKINDNHLHANSYLSGHALSWDEIIYTGSPEDRKFAAFYVK